MPPRPTLLFIAAAALSASLSAQVVARDEYASRRLELMRRIPDGITLLHSESAEKPESQPSFIQNSTFYYFTGQPALPSAVLALDAPARETLLFLPPVLAAFGFRVEGVVPEHGWLLGEFTLADISVASVFRSLGYVGHEPKAETHPNTASWYARVCERPAWKTIAAQEAQR